MTAWYAIPSAAPVEQARACVAEWRRMGYAVAVLVDDWRDLGATMTTRLGAYPGYAAAVNELARLVLAHDPSCSVVATGGDDVYPDQARRAGEVEREFVEHFGGTLGVMQPSGGDLTWSRNAPRIAWSPWLGREWCRRANRGAGPMWPGYLHGWADRELRQVAERHGAFWSNGAVAQRHDTWRRRTPKVRPAHLAAAARHAVADEALHREREAAGFPGSELAP